MRCWRLLSGAGASYPVYGLDVFLRDLRVFVTALTSLITTPSPSRVVSVSPSRVVSVSPTFTCLTCFNTAPSAPRHQRRW